MEEAAVGKAWLPTMELIVNYRRTGMHLDTATHATRLRRSLALTSVSVINHVRCLEVLTCTKSGDCLPSFSVIVWKHIHTYIETDRQIQSIPLFPRSTMYLVARHTHWSRSFLCTAKINAGLFHVAAIAK